MTRLIDADALIADIESFNRPLCDDYHMKGYVLDQIITDIKSAPTVDAEPVRHGRWKRPHGHDNARVCSVCKMICHEDNAKFYNYCPNCGAKMEAERKEE